MTHALVLRSGQALPALCAKCASDGALLERRLLPARGRGAVSVPLCARCDRRVALVAIIPPLMGFVGILSLAAVALYWYVTDPWVRSFMFWPRAFLAVVLAGLEAAFIRTRRHRLTVERLDGGKVKLRGVAPAVARAAGRVKEDQAR